MTVRGIYKYHITRPEKILTALFVFVPPVALICAVIQAWGEGVDFFYLSLLGIFYMLTGLGITVGFHRYFTHGSFKTSPLIETILLVCGSAAVEKDVFKWCAAHRLHHQKSDVPGDPHSPHSFGSGGWAICKGFVHAHVGWLFTILPKDILKNVSDLYEKPRVRIIGKLFPLWVLLGLLIPAITGALYEHSWNGFFLGFLWGGLVRIALVHHVTWSTNSVCHIWGDRPFNTRKDRSTNNFFCAMFSMGEGWHNNHHKYPRSARHGLQPGEFDLSWSLVHLCQKLGWVWDVKVPSQTEIQVALSSKSSFRT